MPSDDLSNRDELCIALEHVIFSDIPSHRIRHDGATALSALSCIVADVITSCVEYDPELKLGAVLDLFAMEVYENLLISHLHDPYLRMSVLAPKESES